MDNERPSVKLSAPQIVLSHIQATNINMYLTFKCYKNKTALNLSKEKLTRHETKKGSFHLHNIFA